MRGRVLVVALFLLTLVPAAAVLAAGSRATAAALRVVHLRPLDVRGSGFRSGERVKVSFGSASVDIVRFVRASTGGAFAVSFGVVAMPRCEAYSVSAIGRAGTRATLRARPLCPVASGRLDPPGAAAGAPGT